jgi:pimeloyl-ACP methyl ester carboxylesterase
LRAHPPIIPPQSAVHRTDAAHPPQKRAPAGFSDPRVARFFEKLASFSRLILFDKRGTGLSDPVAGPAPLEERMDDLRAVMDAAGSERAAIAGFSEGGPLAILGAAAFERSAASPRMAKAIYDMVVEIDVRDIPGRSLRHSGATRI